MPASALRSDAGQTRWGVYIFDADNELYEAAVQLECEVFLDTYGNDAQVMEREYGPYEQNSVFIGLVHHPTCELVGVYRLLVGAVEGLKTIRDLQSEARWSVGLEEIKENHGVDLADLAVLDIATLSVAAQWRRADGGVASRLSIAMLWLASLHLDADAWLAVLDLRAARVITRVVGLVFEPVCGLPVIDYLDSPKSFAGLFQTSDFWREFRSPYAEVEGVIRGQPELISGGISMPQVDLNRLRSSASVAGQLVQTEL